MELFIRIQAGQAIDHPILADNFRAAFPDIDTNNLPPDYARFQRIPKPIINVYEVYEGVEYVWDGNMVRDQHHVRAMTMQEKIAKQDEIKNIWAINNGFSSWTFNEETCAFDPPYPMPQDGKRYHWDEITVAWVKTVDNE